MNLRRFIYPCALLILIGAAIFAKITYFSEEKPFYVRLKKRKSRSPYSLCNLEIHKSAITGDLTDGSSVFTFQLNFPDDNIIHFQINDPLLPRYTVQDVVITDSKNINPNDVRLEKHNDTIQIVLEEILIVINCKDLEINIYKDDLIVSANTRKFLTIGKGEPSVAIALDFFFPGAAATYGLPQRAEQMALKANKKPYRLFNADRFAYSASNNCESLYGAVPLLFAHGIERTVGLLWLNSSETFVDIDHSKEGLNSTFYSESGSVDFFILSGPNLQDCVKQNLQLTGSAPLPPLFALGYHQSRFSYMTQGDMMEVSDKFDENELPLDAIWMDIDYTDDKKYFTWNPKTYPDPEGLLKFLEEKKRKAVAIIDPHIKVDENYPVYKHCKQEDFFVKNTDNTIFTANCWPGQSAWIDFFNPKARKYYAHLHETFAKARNLHIWNDMNEPALFETKENSMPKNLVHHGNWKHRDVHNLYGFYQTMATYDGLVKRLNLRPFILTRSHFAGSQRYAAVWTGDNTAEWAHLKISIPMCLTASLTGFSLCGADVGGFVHHPTEELLQRWYQLGAWLPFFRGHSNRNVPRREPYVYSDEVLGRIREALQQRYRHLLYWYTLFWEHCTTLEPVIRPLVYQYPQDQNLLGLDNQFLVGRNVLVCPVTQPGQVQLEVYLPGGETEIWYSLTKDKASKFKGNGYVPLLVNLNTTPVFYRGGSIIPIMENFVESSAYIYDYPIALYIFCDKDGAATGSLYLDDGESFDYLRNVYCYLKFTLKDCQISGIPVNQNSSYDQSLILSSIYLFGYRFKVNAAEVLTDNFFQSRPQVENLRNCVQIRDVKIDIQEDFVVHLKNNSSVIAE